MKKVILALILSTLAVTGVFAQDKKGPQIEFKKEVHDYGTIENGADGTCEFKFKNIGKEPLIIKNCKASCGCTVPNWPKDPIKPGKSGIIKVKYNTKRTGAINKAVTITSNSVNAPTKVVRIKGTVKPAPAQATTRDGMVPKTTTKTAATKNTAPATTPPAKQAEPKKSAKKWYQFWKKN